jgi:hypothetical protein
MMEHRAVLLRRHPASERQRARPDRSPPEAQHELLIISFARDPNHKTEVPIGSGLDAGDGILDDSRPSRFDPEQLCGHQEGGHPLLSGQSHRTARQAWPRPQRRLHRVVSVSQGSSLVPRTAPNHRMGTVSPVSLRGVGAPSGYLPLPRVPCAASSFDERPVPDPHRGHIAVVAEDAQGACVQQEMLTAD